MSHIFISQCFLCCESTNRCFIYHLFLSFFCKSKDLNFLLKKCAESGLCAFANYKLTESDNYLMNYRLAWFLVSLTYFLIIFFSFFITSRFSFLPIVSAA